MKLKTLITCAVLGYSAASLTAQEPKKDFPPIPIVDLKRKEPTDYAKDVEPVFANKCFVCHSGSVVEGKFDMSTHAGVMKGGKRGVAVVAGKSSESNIFLFCSRQKKPIMPPKSDDPLTPEELTIVKLWIDEGAKAPTMARLKPKIVVSLPPVLLKPVRAVSVSPDGKFIAASRGNQIHLFDGKKGDYLKSYNDIELKTNDGQPAKTAHISLVESIAFSADGKLLASGSFQEVVIWDVESGKIKKRITGFADRVTAIAFSPNDKLLATGGGAATEDGEIRIFEVESGKQLADIKNGHSDTVFAVAFSPDGTKLATCAADKFVKVFEVPGGKFIKSFEGHTHHVMGVGWTADGKKIASCGADNFIKVWDFEKGEKIRDMQGHQKQVTQLWFVGKTPQFLTVSGDSTIRMWNADSGGTIRQYPGASDFLYAVSASSDGTIVAAGGEDGFVRIYNGTNGSLVKAAVPPEAEPKKSEVKQPKK